MTTEYGYGRSEFLELEPDEIAAAIFPAIRQHIDTAHQISDWNLINHARATYGSDVAARVAEGCNGS